MRYIRKSFWKRWVVRAHDQDNDYKWIYNELCSMMHRACKYIDDWCAIEEIDSVEDILAIQFFTASEHPSSPWSHHKNFYHGVTILDRPWCWRTVQSSHVCFSCGQSRVAHYYFLLEQVVLLLQADVFYKLPKMTTMLIMIVSHNQWPSRSVRAQTVA